VRGFRKGLANYPPETPASLDLGADERLADALDRAGYVLMDKGELVRFQQDQMMLELRLMCANAQRGGFG
jgi:hypothetical protein